jgi:hypothetical protein
VAIKQPDVVRERLNLELVEESVAAPPQDC